MKKIDIVDYDPEWPRQFWELKDVYTHALGNHALSIEHVGSTSVPGLSAKPVLDIDIIVSDEVDLNNCIQILNLLGYYFAGDQGIKERYAFKQVSNLTPNNGLGRSWPKHHLYCCLKESSALKNHLLFRDALRNSPKLARQYGDLKRYLAQTTDNMDAYVESKSSFISQVLIKAGVSPENVADIIEQNRKK